MTMNYRRFYAGRHQPPAGTALGYPVPGPQAPTSEEIAGRAFFASACDWQTVLRTSYDFIVIGTGPTGVAFVTQALAKNPQAKILVLDRGVFWLPTHYQMLPKAFQATSGSPPTTYPWSRTHEMATTGAQFFQAGYIPAIGGRSTYWSAWSPSPRPDLMRDWPQELIDVTLKPGFWERAKSFLHVTAMDQIKNGVYGSLQEQLDANIQRNFRKMVPSAEHAFPAPIAVGNTGWKGVKFYKYSTVGALLDLQANQRTQAANGSGQALTLVDRCVVEHLIHDGKGTVIALETSRGVLSVGSAKIIMAMGTIPPVTLLMNSFKHELPNAGKRYTGHFMSHVTARVRRSAFRNLSPLELGAIYLEGKSPSGYQYHVQTSAFAAANPLDDATTIAYEAPDAAAVASMPQLLGSEDYVVFVCATLGEVSEKNASNWIRLNGGSDPTVNISLQLQLDHEDLKLWNVLDEATYQTIAALVSDGAGATPDIEYWVDGPNGSDGTWQHAKPEQHQIRLNIIVHEASPLWIGKDPANSVVNLEYRPHGVNNVYVTGGALFPTSGSWNPTLTMCGLAQDLADRLT